MAKRALEQLQPELEKACDSLRQFTLGKRGCTPQDGAAAIERVGSICDLLKEGFASGPTPRQPRPPRGGKSPRPGPGLRS